MQSAVRKIGLLCLLCWAYTGESTHSLYAQDRESSPWTVSRGSFVGPAFIFTDFVLVNYGAVVGLEWNPQPRWWLQLDLALAYGKEPYYESPDLYRSQYTSQLSFIAQYDLLDFLGFYRLRFGGGLGVNTLYFQYYDYLEFWNDELKQADRDAEVVFSPFLSMVVENNFRITNQHVFFVKLNMQLINYPLSVPQTITLKDGSHKTRLYEMHDAVSISIGWRYLFD